MPFRGFTRCAFAPIAAALTLAGALDAAAQSVQYRFPAGVEYRSLADTELSRLR